MANTISVEIVDADSSVYSGNGVLVSATASMGEIGIMHGHTPLLSSLKPGHVTVKHEDGSEDTMFIIHKAQNALAEASARLEFIKRIHH